MDITPNLSLSYLASNQAQKHVTLNEALRRLDALVHIRVKSLDIDTLPQAPEEGERFIVAEGAGGDLEGRGRQIAAFLDGAWMYFAPQPGWRIWHAQLRRSFVFDGDAWIEDGGAHGEQLPRFGVNGAPDDTNRLVVKSDAALLSHDDVTPGSGDARQVINKASTGQVASVVFQTGYSGRAEFGLVGSDEFAVNVSADGIAWSSGLRFDSGSGAAGFGMAAGVNQISVAGGDAQYSEPGLRLFPTMHATSQRAALAVGDWLIGQDSFGNGTKDLFVFDANAGVSRGLVGASGGFVWGAPAGGDRGAGTINAQAVYDDQALLSCYVFDQFLDGAIDERKWDAKVPDEKVGLHVATGAAQGGGTPRTHQPMRLFKARIGSAYDPLTLDGYARHWREKRHLSSMPNEAGFDPELGLPTGAWIQRLIETAEIQAILIETLNQRLKALAAISNC